MIRRFVEALGSVPVEDRATERRALDGIAVATARDVPAGEHELEFARARLAEQGDGAAAEPFLAAVVLHLLRDFLGVFGAVQTGENLANHRLLVFGVEFGNLFVCNHPVVVHLRAQRVVEREANGFLLFFVEALEERRDERF